MRGGSCALRRQGRSSRRKASAARAARSAAIPVPRLDRLLRSDFHARPPASAHLAARSGPRRRQVAGENAYRGELGGASLAGYGLAFVANRDHTRNAAAAGSWRRHRPIRAARPRPPPEGAIAGRQVGKQWITTPGSRGLRRRRWRPGANECARGGRSLPRVRALSFFSGAMGMGIIRTGAGGHPRAPCLWIDEASGARSWRTGPTWRFRVTSGVRWRAGQGGGWPRRGRRIDVMVGGPPWQGLLHGGRVASSRTTGATPCSVKGIHPRTAPPVRGHRERCAGSCRHRSRIGLTRMIQRVVSARRRRASGGAMLHVLDRLRAGGYGVFLQPHNAANWSPSPANASSCCVSRDGSVLPPPGFAGRTGAARAIGHSPRGTGGLDTNSALTRVPRGSPPFLPDAGPGAVLEALAMRRCTGRPWAPRWTPGRQDRLTGLV